MTNFFHAPITELPKVGKVRASLCAKLGLKTVGDLLYHFPRSYQDRGDIRKVCLCEPEVTHAFLLTVATPPKTARLSRSMSITKFTVFDDSGKASVTFFNQPFVKDVFCVGATYRFFGKLKKKGGLPELVSPQYELYNESAPPADLYPVYPLTAGLNNKTMTAMVKSAFAPFTRDGICYLPETLPSYLIEEYGLLSAGAAVSGLHFPSDLGGLEKARRRLFFEQMLVFSLGISVNRRQMNACDRKPFPMEKMDDQPLLSRLGFAFTGAQRRAADEIASDMTAKNKRPMTRLLSGDVGSGKTAVAAYAAYQAVANGLQVSLMAPTEILARQHYKDLAPLFESMGYATALLLGSTRAVAKKSIYAGMQRGQISLVIGTHALLNENALFHSLGLVITDEQHRFGFAQRAALLSQTLDKAHYPHMLAMSATPIPRTMALIVYGDMDLSHLNELPPGRQRVDTFLVDESYRQRLNGFIRKQTEAGGQVYIVCPAVESDSEEESEDAGGDGETLMPLKAAVNYAQTLKNEIFPDLNVGFIHGKMNAADKDRVMEAFAANEIHILVSTTVIEVGVNVPNATLMIVENADRFGLSQLHQLRGRVGRGSKKAYCVLVSDSKNEKTRERLTVMKTTYDGYRIAEQDLAQRGPGDFLPSKGGGLRQHGEMEFNLSPAGGGDMELLRQAVDCAKAIAESDPDLSEEKNALLKKAVGELFEGDINA